MAALRTIFKANALKNALISRVPVISTTRLYWTKDWKPGPYPKTPAERAAAAKKYGLLPEDYEPYPDDGLGLGDYPKLPVVSGDHRDPFGDWDFPRQKRNFGEIIHADVDSHGEDRIDLNLKTYPAANTKALIFISTMVIWVGFCWVDSKYKYYHPVMPKQLYKEGVVHYLLEPDENPQPAPAKKSRFF
uniref:NADH dehydrogenase [ubiquinone] 1 beta subcomplex subunit 8, mitochondrial n=1 Tax=Strigamia maritima TaxID=126957 RepID=T1JCK7_STRMM